MYTILNLLINSVIVFVIVFLKIIFVNASIYKLKFILDNKIISKNYVLNLFINY